MTFENENSPDNTVDHHDLLAMYLELQKSHDTLIEKGKASKRLQKKTDIQVGVELRATRESMERATDLYDTARAQNQQLEKNNVRA